MRSVKSLKRKNENIESDDETLKLLEEMRPKIRGDCKNIPRPCIFVSCKYNLFLEVNQSSGRLKILFPGCSTPNDLRRNNCVLDIVEKTGGMTLEDIGKEMNVTRERVRQIGDAAMRKMRPYTDGFDE